MYGAMRERAPASTRLAGSATALTVTAALAIAVVVGMGGQALAVKDEPLMFTVMPEETVTPPPESRNPLELETDLTLDVVTPEVERLVFEVEDSPTRITVDPAPRANTGPATPGEANPRTAPKAPGVWTMAKLVPAAAPPYPAAAIRRGDEGVSALEVCLDARGRVTSAAIATSSGHAVLDEAALKWVRAAKFTPAKLDGSPLAVCKHSVAYEWTLNRR